MCVLIHRVHTQEPGLAELPSLQCDSLPSVHVWEGGGLYSTLTAGKKSKATVYMIYSAGVNHHACKCVVTQHMYILRQMKSTCICN